MASNLGYQRGTWKELGVSNYLQIHPDTIIVSYRFAKFDLYQPIFVKVYVTLYFYVYHAHTMGLVFSPTSMFLFMVNCRYIYIPVPWIRHKR